MKLSDIFHVNKPIIGMLHLTGNDHESIFEQAKIEIAQMYDCGVDGIPVDTEHVTEFMTAVKRLRERC